MAALCASIGLALIVIAIGIDAARDGHGWGATLYWGGLVFLVVPPAARLAGSTASRGERIALLLMLGLALLAAEYFVAPLGFSNHDEFGHLRETRDIISNASLLSDNPIQAEYTYFPGTSIATGAFAHLSGLSIFASWRLLLVALRIVLVLSLFLIFERASNSPRNASLGVLLYFGSSNFMYFDAHFSYESFALPLGFLLIQRAAASEDRGPRWAPWVIFAILLVALTVSHHLAAYFVVGLFAVFALIAHVAARKSPSERRFPVRTLALYAIAALAVVLLWTTLVASTIISDYLGPVLSDAVSSTVGFLTGERSAEKTLFESQNHEASPLLEQAVGFAAVGLLLVLLVWGLWRLWKQKQLASPLPATLACLAVAYPATLLFRLTLNGSEASGRASAYVFLGLGYVIAAGVFAVPERFAGATATTRRRLSGVRLPTLEGSTRVAGVSLTIALVLIGGVIVGTSRTERLPGRYYPAVTARAAVDPESIAAAKWAGEHLPPEQVLFSDLTNRLLLSSYGSQNAICCYFDEELLPELFLTPTFTATDSMLIRQNDVALIVVDRRLAQYTPSTHLFFERADGGPYDAPLEAKALAKFSSVRGIGRIFDSGNISVYDTANLTTESADPSTEG